METFTIVACKSDILVAENIVDEIVHGGLFELAAIIRLATEFCGSLDFLDQEV